MSTQQPETAYDLCELVAQHIEEEPRRYYQNVWALIGERVRQTLKFEPACGTVCCRAGWIVALHDGLQAPALLAVQDQRYAFDVMYRALEILGMGEYEVGALFNEFTADDDWAEDGDEIVHAKPGTPEYAKAGADGLRRFMVENEAHLKQRLLKNVPKDTRT